MGNNTTLERTDWETFWKQNPSGFNETMNQSTLFFAQKLNAYLPIQSKDHYLDIGCGPGFLISYLQDKCELIHGTDISENYIGIANENFKGQPHISFSVSKTYDYEHYHQLIVSKKISHVVVLSVLQYYKSTDEVRDLIMSLKETAKSQSFQCILADIIPTKHAVLNDIICIVKHAIKKRYTFKFIKFLFYAVFSDYRKIKKNGLLQIDETFFTAMKDEIKLKIVKDLTIHTGRYSVVIDF